MAVLVLEAGVGALARLYEEQVGPELKMNLNRTFLENYSVRSRETVAIDRMQKEVDRGQDRNFFDRFSNRRVPREYETIGASVPQIGSRFCSRASPAFRLRMALLLPFVSISLVVSFIS